VSLDQSGSLDDVFNDGAEQVGTFGYNLIDAVKTEVAESNFASNTFKAKIDDTTSSLGTASDAQTVLTPLEELTASGNTNIEAAILNCQSQLDGPDKKADRVLVLVGDGAPTACETAGCTDLGSATAAANAAKNADILLITVFIGDPQTRGFKNFQDFATPGGYAFRIDNPTTDELESVISDVVDSVVCGDTFTFSPTASPVS